MMQTAILMTLSKGKPDDGGIPNAFATTEQHSAPAGVPEYAGGGGAENPQNPYYPQTDGDPTRGGRRRS